MIRYGIPFCLQTLAYAVFVLLCEGFFPYRQPLAQTLQNVCRLLLALDFTCRICGFINFSDCAEVIRCEEVPELQFRLAYRGELVLYPYDILDFGQLDSGSVGGFYNYSRIGSVGKYNRYPGAFRNRPGGFVSGYPLQAERNNDLYVATLMHAKTKI